MISLVPSQRPLRPSPLAMSIVAHVLAVMTLLTIRLTSDPTPVVRPVAISLEAPRLPNTLSPPPVRQRIPPRPTPKPVPEAAPSTSVPSTTPSPARREFRPPAAAPSAASEPAIAAALPNVPEFAIDQPVSLASKTDFAATLPKPVITGGLTDARAVLASGGRTGSLQSSGFGAASPVARRQQNAATVRQAAFGNVRVSASAPATRPVETASTTPVEILSKPQPEYTDQARALHIEGEVLLEMLFAASGQAQVLRLVQGLGHGLNEAAIAAARAIRFSPAKREGLPVDSSAVVHIVFQLAY